MPKPPPPQDPPFEILRALDDAGLTKGQFRVIAHVWRRGECFERVREMARRCRMNHAWVRVVVRQLVLKQMMTRELNPGHTNTLRLTPLASWLFETADEKALAEKRSQSSESLSLDVQAEFYQRLGVSLNRVEAAWFKQCLVDDVDRFERVMADVADRVKRGPKVKSVCALWTDTWKRFKQSVKTKCLVV